MHKIRRPHDPTTESRNWEEDRNTTATLRCVQDKKIHRFDIIDITSCTECLNNYTSMNLTEQDCSRFAAGHVRTTKLRDYLTTKKKCSLCGRICHGMDALFAHQANGHKCEPDNAESTVSRVLRSRPMLSKPTKSVEQHTAQISRFGAGSSNTHLGHCRDCGNLYVNMSCHKICSKKLIYKVPCEDCGKLFFDLSNHKSCSRRLVTYVCPDCGLSYPKASNHTRCAKRPPYVCPDCGYLFLKKSTHRRCSRRLVNRKPYECRDCGLSFVLKSNHTECSRSLIPKASCVCPDCGQPYMHERCSERLVENSKAVRQVCDLPVLDLPRGEFEHDVEPDSSRFIPAKHVTSSSEAEISENESNSAVVHDIQSPAACGSVSPLLAPTPFVERQQLKGCGDLFFDVSRHKKCYKKRIYRVACEDYCGQLLFDLSNHKISSRRPVPYVCPDCGLSYPNKQNHKRCAKRPPHVCPDCGNLFLEMSTHRRCPRTKVKAAHVCSERLVEINKAVRQVRGLPVLDLPRGECSQAQIARSIESYLVTAANNRLQHTSELFKPAERPPIWYKRNCQPCDGHGLGESSNHVMCSLELDTRKSLISDPVQEVPHRSNAYINSEDQTSDGGGQSSSAMSGPQRRSSSSSSDGEPLLNNIEEEQCCPPMTISSVENNELEHDGERNSHPFMPAKHVDSTRSFSLLNYELEISENESNPAVVYDHDPQSHAACGSVSRLSGPKLFVKRRMSRKRRCQASSRSK